MADLSMETIVGDALRRAYSLGQIYWQQADSDYVSQNKKADATASKFAKLVDEIVKQVAARRAVPAQASAPAAELMAVAEACVAQGCTAAMEDWLDAQVPAQGEMVAKAEPKLAHGHRGDWHLMANARILAGRPIHVIRTMPNWVLASNLFATGSTSARQICVDAGVDPDATTVTRIAATKQCAEGG